MERVEITVSLASWAAERRTITGIREQVFIQEQGVPASLEWDGLDEAATHFLARDADGNPVGTARLLSSGQIGRVAVLPAWRSQGAGKALLAAGIAAARDAGFERVFLNAQSRVARLYEQAGFQAVGDEFSEAGIPHRRMEKML
jgi:predicted GNAT family N-acyltransferase